MVYKKKPKNFKPKFELVGCLFEYKGKILLLQRREDKSQGGKWGMPAGKINIGEEKLEALAREINEETGNLIDPKNFIFLKSFYVNHFDDFIFYMYTLPLKKLIQVKLNPEEHVDYKWITPEESLKLDFVEDFDESLKEFTLNNHGVFWL